MSSEKLLGNALSKLLRNSFMKWFAIGLGAAVVVGSIVGVSVYFSITGPNVPNNGGSFPERLANSMRDSFPDILHMQIGGNASGYIDSRMIWSEFYREGTSENYVWNATAQLLFPSEEINFVVNKSDVEGIAQAMYDSIRACEFAGIWGQPPYELGEDLPNMKYVTELYFENGTAAFLYVNMGGLVLYQTTTWTGNFNANMNMIGSSVLTPESAFESYVTVMAALFEPYTGG